MSIWQVQGDRGWVSGCRGGRERLLTRRLAGRGCEGLGATHTTWAERGSLQDPPAGPRCGPESTPTRAGVGSLFPRSQRAWGPLGLRGEGSSLSVCGRLYSCREVSGSGHLNGRCSSRCPSPSSPVSPPHQGNLQVPATSRGTVAPLLPCRSLPSAPTRPHLHTHPTLPQEGASLRSDHLHAQPAAALTWQVRKTGSGPWWSSSSCAEGLWLRSCVGQEAWPRSPWCTSSTSVLCWESPCPLRAGPHPSFKEFYLKPAEPR